jgi:MFS transporter, MHS family, alpha-ketoglutarate permease
MATITLSRSQLRQVLAASSGNVVEWYDWLIYSYLSVYFADQVFPDSGNRLVPILATFAIFAVGFVMRPVGGLVLGVYADRLGRRAAMVLTVTIMGAGQILMTALPTYEQVGVLSPVLLLIIRLGQGFAVGGEFAISSVFLVESAPPGARGLYSSYSYVGSNLGQLLAAGAAALMSNLVSESGMHDWGWRVPFAVGAVACLVGIWIRRGTVETHADVDRMVRGEVGRPHLFEFLRRHPRQAATIVGMTVGPTVAFYTWAVYLPTYANITRGYDPARALTVSTLALVVFTVIQPVAGVLSDRIGRRPLLIGSALGFALLTVPLLAMLGTSFWNLMVITLIGMVFLTGYTAVCAAAMVELFPARVRTAGIGFPYSLTVAAFGGTAPFLATLLVDSGHAALFGWYVAATALISAVVFIRMPETKDRDIA